MDNFQIAHDLAVAKLFSEFLGNLDDSHICQKYFKYRTDFSKLLNSHDENYFLNELNKKKVNNCSSVKRPF